MLNVQCSMLNVCHLFTPYCVIILTSFKTINFTRCAVFTTFAAPKQETKT